MNWLKTQLKLAVVLKMNSGRRLSYVAPDLRAGAKYFCESTSIMDTDFLDMHSNK